MKNLDDFTDRYDYAEQRHISVRGVIDFTHLTNPFGPSEKAKHAIRKAVKDVNRPPDPHTRYLRRYIAKKEGIEPESILFGHGSAQLLSVLIAAFTPKRLLFPGPVSPSYRELIERHGSTVVPLPLYPDNGAGTDVEARTRLLAGADMLLLPNPNDITGEAIREEDLAELAGRFQDLEKPVVIDEALIEFTESDSALSLTKAYPNIVVIRDFSLFHSLAGLPLGYLVASPTIVGKVRSILEAAPVSSVGAAAALASLRDVGFRNRTREYVRAEKDYLKGKLGGIKDLDITDTPCNFLLLRTGRLAAELQTALRGRNIIVSPIDEENGKVLLRVPVRRRRENASFAKTLLRVMSKEPSP